MLLAKFPISVNGVIIWIVAQIKNWVILDHSIFFLLTSSNLPAGPIGSTFKFYFEFDPFFLISSATTLV